MNYPEPSSMKTSYILQKLSTLQCLMQVFRICTTIYTTADPKRSYLRNYLDLSELLY